MSELREGLFEACFKLKTICALEKESFWEGWRPVKALSKAQPGNMSTVLPYEFRDEVHFLPKAELLLPCANILPKFSGFTPDFPFC
jgi:hypothetical protein